MNSSSSSNSCSNSSTPSSSNSQYTPFANPQIWSIHPPNYSTTAQNSPIIGRSPINFIGLSQSQGEQQGYYDRDSQHIPNTQFEHITNLFGGSSQTPMSPQIPCPSQTQPSQTRSNRPSQSQPAQAPIQVDDNVEEECIVAKRKGHFVTKEDDLIVKYWLEVSEDPITGRDQKKNTFWDRIAVVFNANSQVGIERTGRALESRFATVRNGLNHFYGIHTKVEIENPSGKTHLDKHVISRKRYKNEYKKEFLWQTYFELIKDKPRWHSATAALQHKEKMMQAQNKSNTPIIEDEESSNVRLVDGLDETSGRGKAKMLKALQEANLKPLEATQEIMKSYIEDLKEGKEDKKVDQARKMTYLEENSEINKELVKKCERAVLAKEKIPEAIHMQETRKKILSDMTILKEASSMSEERRKNVIAKLQEKVLQYYEQD